MASNKIFEPSFTIDYKVSEIDNLFKDSSRINVKFEEIEKIERIVDFRKKYIMEAFVITFLITGICGMIYYSYSVDLNLSNFEQALKQFNPSFSKFDSGEMLIQGFVTGVIWASIAAAIATFASKAVPQYRIYLKSNKEMDVLVSEQDFITLNSIINPEFEIASAKTQNQNTEKTHLDNFEKSSDLESATLNTDNSGNKIYSDKYDSLIKLKELLEMGIISQNEFDDEKKKILQAN